MFYISFIKLSFVLLGSSLFFVSNTQAAKFPKINGIINRKNCIVSSSFQNVKVNKAHSCIVSELCISADIHRCHSGDTDCVIRTSINLLRQHARKGYPAAAFPIVEPFHLKEFDVSDGRGGSLNLKLNFRDVDVVGLSGVNFDRAVGFGADPKTSKFELYGSFPKISIRSKYKADGRILILPIRGDGNADIVLENPQVSVKFKPSTFLKDGRTYLSVDKLKVLIEPLKMTIKLTNLFNGDPGLGAHMNQFLNENWYDVWSELQPSVHATIADVMKSILKPIFQKFPYEELYEDLATQ